MNNKKLMTAFMSGLLVISLLTGCSSKSTVSLKSTFGTEESINGRAGVCVPYDALADEARMELVCREYNSITCENEMKPESLLGTTPTLSDEVDEYGDQIPVLDFTKADAILDYVLDYNAQNPNDTIAVRGHVLVWHSQTPTWFFREGYSSSGDYVSKEQMLSRMEWYIKTVIEHFDGEDSPYRGLIYAWDVVNEQIETGDFDPDTNPAKIRQTCNGVNTDWYEIFQGDISYITNAFVFANRYAPATVKLFYNDYGDADDNKIGSICNLISEIKATSGARIDGMGMQGHYGLDWTKVSSVERAIRAYSELVDEIQITELDMQSSGYYNGSTESVELQLQADMYGNLFDLYTRLDHEEGIDITSITFWGTHDSASWLQYSSDVGGGADGSHVQIPLLFDDDMNPKPAYYRILGIEEPES